MKANELRIGNYVKSNDVNMAPYFTVTASFLKQNENEMSWFIDPIQLTKEWLEKFGFEKVEFAFKKNGLRLFPIRDLYYRANYPITVDVKHVHQLQNLYFALTGKEL